MGPTIIARNYAETLLALAERQGAEAAVDEYASAIRHVSEMLQSEPRIREFLDSPRLDAATKKRAVRTAFEGHVPDPFLRFLLVVVEKRRERLLSTIAEEYQQLIDERHGRLRAQITLSHPATPEFEQEIVDALERRYRSTIIPQVRVDPSLIGGAVIRVGDEILDGSLRRRLSTLRRRLADVRLPQPVAG